MEEIKIYEETTKLEKNDTEANKIAKFLVQSLKLVFETYFSDNEKKNISLDFIFKTVDVNELSKKERNYNIELFDDSLKYYTDLRNYFLFPLSCMDDKSAFKIPEIKNKIKSNFSKYYLSILLDLLLEVLTVNPKHMKMV